MVLPVPPARSPVLPDGEVEEDAWTAPARTGLFRDATGAFARPSSEARLLWDARNLYLVLYAGDEDIEARDTPHDGPVWLDDSFSILLAPPGQGVTYTIDVSARGAVTDARRGRAGAPDATWESGIRVGLDRDGTISDPSDDDEEWIVEAALPWASLGVTPAAGMEIGLALRRCDVPRGGKRTCAAWGEEANGWPTGAILLQ